VGAAGRGRVIRISDLWQEFADPRSTALEQTLKLLRLWFCGGRPTLQEAIQWSRTGRGKIFFLTTASSPLALFDGFQPFGP
jgi:hypothetical protein